MAMGPRRSGLEAEEEKRGGGEDENEDADGEEDEEMTIWGALRREGIRGAVEVTPE